MTGTEEDQMPRFSVKAKKDYRSDSPFSLSYII